MGKVCLCISEKLASSLLEKVPHEITYTSIEKAIKVCSWYRLCIMDYRIYLDDGLSPKEITAGIYVAYSIHSFIRVFRI